MAEEGEIDAAVFAMLDEERVRAEIVCLSVFHDEQSAGCEQLALQDALRNFWKFGQGVGRVGKDEVEAPGSHEI